MREVRSFVLLAEQLHFGRAAKLLHLSQPALTKQIRKLEKALGGALFERGTHGTRLSALGQQFLPEARSAVQAFDQLLARGRRTARGETGRLRLGFGFHTFKLVPRLIVRLREVAPGIEVSLRDLSTAEQIDGLGSGRLDLGFVRTPAPKGLQTMPVIRDRLALVSSANARLPAKLGLADCREEPFVTISEERAPGFYHHTLRLCAKEGFHPRIVQSVPEFTTALALVQAGLGVAAIPESFWSSRFEGVRFHPLRDREAGWSVAAAWNRGDGNPALKRFLELLREELKRA